jgi:hypothetical protein
MEIIREKQDGAISIFARDLKGLQGSAQQFFI